METGPLPDLNGMCGMWYSCARNEYEVVLRRRTLLESAKYYLVSGGICCPEAAVKTVEAKRLLKNGEMYTMSEAARAVGISRSVFYKYNDKVHPFYDRGIDRTVTLYAQLQDRAGVLSSFLGIFLGRAPVRTS